MQKKDAMGFKPATLYLTSLLHYQLGYLIHSKQKSSQKYKKESDQKLEYDK